MGAARTHAFDALERAFVEMYHRHVPVQPVAEREAALALRTSMVALLKMRHAIVFVGIPSLGKRLVTQLTGKRFQAMCGTDVCGQLSLRAERALALRAVLGWRSRQLRLRLRL